uniref:Putative secreted protein n=1 Tax=Anopheles darlingi TaxID=43151 RepID=A0A2M4DAG6_ANODA
MCRRQSGPRIPAMVWGFILSWLAACGRTGEDVLLLSSSPSFSTDFLSRWSGHFLSSFPCQNRATQHTYVWFSVLL